MARQNTKKPLSNRVAEAKKKTVKKPLKEIVLKIKRKGEKPLKKMSVKAKSPAVVGTSKHKETQSSLEKKLSHREKKLLEIKNKLLGQKEALLAEAGEVLNALPGEINFPDMGDQATAETYRNFMLRLRGRERTLLKKIDEAIERLDNGTFGICEECGEAIDIRRLDARPVTTLCINCKTQQEEEERRQQGVA